ncbi:MAG: hypothetical protein IJB85_03110 [Clostridia bacterium]|nr:hypothetical protein [Clostridia bacterium]
MKKVILAAVLVLVLLVCGGCAREEAADQGPSIVEAVSAGYEGVDQTGNNKIRVELGEGATGVFQVDMISETHTLVRPYIFVELGIGFNQLEHSQRDFSGIFNYTLNELLMMQQSPEHKALAELMNSAVLGDGVQNLSVTFKDLGYVADPQRQCEILFTGVAYEKDGPLIRDEAYAFCRFGMMDQSKQPLIMNVLITEQNAVFEIARRVHQRGLVSAEMEAWMQRKLGQ